MTEEAEERRAADEIIRWLDDPQQHLDNSTRRKALEGMLIRHFDRARAQATRKARVGTMTMWVSALLLLMTFSLNSAKIWELLGW